MNKHAKVYVVGSRTWILGRWTEVSGGSIACAAAAGNLTLLAEKLDELRQNIGFAIDAELADTIVAALTDYIDLADIFQAQTFSAAQCAELAETLGELVPLCPPIPIDSGGAAPGPCDARAQLLTLAAAFAAAAAAGGADMYSLGR